MPGSNTWSYSPLNGRSVPFSRRTRNCSGVRSRRHSASVFLTFAGTSFLSFSVSPFSLAKGASVSAAVDAFLHEPRRHADGLDVRRDVLRHDRSGADDGARTHGHPIDHDRAHGEIGAPPDPA